MSVPLSKAALAAFEAWSHGEHGAMKHVMDKHRGGAPRLALVLEFLWWAANPIHEPISAPELAQTWLAAKALILTLILTLNSTTNRR